MRYMQLSEGVSRWFTSLLLVSGVRSCQIRFGYGWQSIDIHIYAYTHEKPVQQARHCYQHPRASKLLQLQHRHWLVHPPCTCTVTCKVIFACTATFQDSTGSVAATRMGVG